jgi:hypothetical protein
MRFRILTIAYLFALIAAAMTFFGNSGILTAAGIALFWYAIFRGAFATFLPWLLMAAIVCLAVLALSLPSVQSRPASPRNHCLNNLKQISLALQNYRQHHGSYPPAYIADAAGKPMHSWRVLILPFMEHRSLFDEYDFNEPWDGPNNRKLWNQMPEAYSCPGRDRARSLGLPGNSQNAACYFAVVGEEAAWPGSRGIAESEIKDDPSETLVMLEYSGSEEPWTAPNDLTVDQAIACFETSEPQGHVHVHEGFFETTLHWNHYQAAFANAHGRSVPASLSREAVRAMLTIAGGEPSGQANEPPSEAPLNQVSVIRYDRVYAAIVFAILTVLPAFLLPRRSKGLRTRIGNAVAAASDRATGPQASAPAPPATTLPSRHPPR